MWLVLGGPTPLLGPLPFPGKWDCFCCLSWSLAQSRLWQQGSSVFLGSSTALQVAEGKCLSHTGNRSLSTDGDEDKDRAGEDDPESPEMSPWSSISLCQAPRGPLSACRGVGALGGSVPAVALPRLRAGYKPTPALSSGAGTAVFPWQSLFVGAALSSPQGQFTAEPRSCSQGLFHPSGCFRGSEQSSQRLPSLESFGGVQARAGHVSPELQCNGNDGSLAPAFQLQLLLLHSQDVAPPECAAFPAPGRG